MDSKKIIKILFIISMFFTLLIGISLSYNYDLANNFDLLFQSDTARVVGDITDLSFNHYRLNVHPLLVLFITPIYNFIKGLVINKMLSLVVLSSLFTSISVVYIYKILELYNKDKKINILLSLCYLFSFSNYVFTAGIEVYNIAALFLIMLWYYVLKRENNFKLDLKSGVVFMLLGILSCGITVTNIIIFCIILFILLIFKKEKFKNLLIVFIFTIVMIFNCVIIQNLIWHNTPGLNYNSLKNEGVFTSYSININKIGNVLREDYSHSILANNIYVKLDTDNANKVEEQIIDFDNNIIINIFTSIFYILSILLLVRNYKKNKFVNTGLILSILFNTILHILYGNGYPFIYSLHFLYLFFILFGINIGYEDNNIIKKISKIYLIILLVFELLINNIIFIKLLRIVESILPCNYYVGVLGLTKCIIYTVIFLLILFSLIYLFIKLINKFKNSDDKVFYGVLLILLFILIHSLFITLEASENNKRIFIWEIKEPYIKNVYINNKKYLKHDYSNLNNRYKDEVRELNSYIKEYKLLKKDYKNKEVNINKENDFYLFGFGSRDKIIFKDSKLVNLTTDRIIKNLDIKEYIIIPNLYTVLIETNNNEFIKIYEDNKGVHYNNIIIDGTDKEIELYNFENNKYKNTLKVLYGEILFNIKESKIYPNIFVYDNPWYRDAAIVSMVLKKTNNTSLISDWVNNIDSIYDMQNKSNKEVDNLGELLYILSTQEKINEKLVSKIEKEAERISEGKYLTGVTDYGERYLYQNLWYKLGIESIGKEFKYDISFLEDDYSNTCWWSDNKVNNNSYNIEVNYPYLTIARYHKLHKGSIVLNKNIYPLSWEKDASEAHYNNINILGSDYTTNRISPLHSWTAAELFLLLFEE